jgi:hypothetical protein
MQLIACEDRSYRKIRPTLEIIALALTLCEAVG